MKFSRFVVPAVLSLTYFSLTSRDAHAAIISWGSATTITGDSDVSTLGTRDRATNLGTTFSATVNGVTFVGSTTGTPRASFVDNSITYSVPTGTISQQEIFATNFDTPYANLSEDYRIFVRSAAYTSGAPLTVSLGDLTAGNSYQVQVWVNDSRANTRTQTINGGGNTVALDFNTTNGDGGLGQFVTGVFTANSTSQAFTLTGTSGQYAQINGLQVRGILTTPEPSTYAMMALGLIALCVLGAKRKKDGQAI